jgi:prepilin peptidase CpaA
MSRAFARVRDNLEAGNLPTVNTAAASSTALPKPSRTLYWVLLLSMSAMIATGVQLVAHRSGAASWRAAGTFVNVFCILLTTIAAWSDAATARIPNMLTYPAFVLGIVFSLGFGILDRLGFHFWLTWSGAPAPLEMLLGFALFGGLGFIAVCLGGMGGGDLKLLAALGVLLGMQSFASSGLFILTAAAALALVNLLTAGFTGRLLRRCAVHLGRRLQLGFELGPDRALPQRHQIPLAVAIWIGLIGALLWQAIAPATFAPGQ